MRTRHYNARDSRSHGENHESPITTANRQKKIHENHSRKKYVERQQGLNGNQPGVREKHSPNSNHETHGNKYIYKMSSPTQVPKYNENQGHKENLRLERKQSLKEDERLDRNRVANWEQKNRRNESGHGEYHRQIHRNKVIDMVVNETSQIRNDQDSPQGFVDYRHASEVRYKSAESKNKSRDINHTLNDTNPKLRNSNKSKSSISCTRLLSADTLNMTHKDKHGNKMDILKERKLKMEQERQPESWYQYRNYKGEFEWRAKYAGEKCEQSEIIYENLAPKRPASVAPRSTAGIKCIGKAITLSSEHVTVNANKDTRKYSEFDSPTQTQKGLKSDVLNKNKGKQRRTPEKCGKSKIDKESGSNNKASKTPQPKIVNISLISPIQEKYKVKHKKSELLTLENIDLLNQSFNDGFVNVSQNKSSLNASLVNENKQKISEWLENLDCTEDSIHKKCFTESDGGNVEVSLDKNKFEDKRNFENEEYRKGNSHKGLNRSERDSFDDSVSKPPSKRFKTGNKDTDASVKEMHKLSSGFIAKSNQHAFHERFKGMSKREMKAFLESDESGVSTLIDLKPKSNAIFVDDYSSFPGSPESDLEVVSWDGAGEDLNIYLDHQEGYTDTNWDEVRRDPSRYLDEVQGYPNVKMDKCRRDPSLHLKEIRGYPNANMDRVRRDPSPYLKEIKGDKGREDLSEYYDEDMVYPPEYLDYVRRNPNKYLDEARRDQISYLGPASPVSDKVQYEMSNDRSFVSPNARQSRESIRNRDRSPRKAPYNAVCRNDKRASSAPTVRREVYPVKRVTSYFRENMNNQSTQTISDNRNGEYREDKRREVTNTVKTLMSPVTKQREQFNRPNDWSSNDTRIWCRQEEKRQDSPCTSMAKLKINTPRSRSSLDRSPFSKNENRNCSPDLYRRSIQNESSKELLNVKVFKHHSEHDSNVYRQSPVKINAVIPRADDAAYERPVSRISNETFTIEPEGNEKENYGKSPLTLNNQRLKSKKNLFTVVGKNNLDNNAEVRHNTKQDKVRPTKQDKVGPAYRYNTPIQDKVRPEYMFSTPVRPGVRLSLNETFSTIVGSEETEMEQDEHVVLIEN